MSDTPLTDRLVELIGRYSSAVGYEVVLQIGIRFGGAQVEGWIIYEPSDDETEWESEVLYIARASSLESLPGAIEAKIAELEKRNE